MAGLLLAPDTRLPAPLIQLVGREGELAAIRALLADEQVRLLTLTGPGGIGKTRLARQIAREPGDAFPDGAAVVELAAVRDAGLVLPTVARALGIPDTGQTSLIERIGGSLAGSRCLLVLDNLEQVVAAAPLFAQLLSLAPAVTILATSRETLRLSGEFEFPVPPLLVPPADAAADNLAALAEIDSVRLFLQRARMVQPAFELDAANAATVAAVCARLDGFPLAIELAASRLRHLSPQSLLARLSASLSILTGGARDLPDRHQTMRNAITWSYELLPPEEQALFRRLSVFAGGFTLDAAEMVSRQTADGRRQNGSTADCRLPTADFVLDGIASLVDKSLLRVVDEAAPVGNGEPRYGMYETIREYGLACLASSGEEAEVRERHAHWCLKLAEDAEEVLTGPDRVLLLRRLEQEQPNLRQALGWVETAGEGETALRLVAALAPFWEIQGHLNEGEEWLERILALPGVYPPEVVGRALAGAAMIAYRRGRYELATAHAERVLALALADREGDSVLAARAITVLGNVAFDRSDLELAVTRYREALARFRAAGDIDGMADTLSKSGLVLTSLGQLAEAAAALEESLALGREWNRPVWVTTSTGRLAFVDQLRGDLVSAEARVTEALPMQRQLNPISAVAHLWLGATVARDAGDFPLSAARYRESLELRWKWGEPRGIAESLAGIVELAELTGRPVTAVRLFGAVEALRQRIGVPGYRWEQERRERAIARARQQLGDDAFAAEFDDGTQMPRPDVIALAVDVARMIEAQVPETPAPAPAPDVHPYDPRELEAIAMLTVRELEVLRWLAGGLSDREIGEALFISPRTVARHLHSIYQKLDVGSRSAATAFAHRNGVA